MSSIQKFLELRESEGMAKLRNKILTQIPQLRSIADKIDGRKVRIGGRWIADFASCNYLGMDLHPEVIAAIEPALREWGVHPSWTRAVCSPEIYDRVEEELAALIGCRKIVLFQTITLIHEGVLPLLAKEDSVIFMDQEAHRSIYEGCRLAHDGGAEFLQVPHNNPRALQEKLEAYQDKAVKIIAVDGVYSMSGNYFDLPVYADLARRYGAIIYIDDAHGFGVIGESAGVTDPPYGLKGNGLVRHFGFRYEEDNVIYVGGLSKAYSSLGAFITCPEGMFNLLTTASTYIFSGPCPVASLASTLACIRVNAREGDNLRRRLYALTRQLIQGAKALGFYVSNTTEFPIVDVRIGSPQMVTEACQILWKYGILITPALFPAMPINKGAVRFTVTAANTEEEVAEALKALNEIREMIEKKKQKEAKGLSD